MLLVVIDSNGSSPGKPGFKMVVTEDGKLFGTIGGGTTEYNLAKLAMKKIRESSDEIFIRQEVHQSDAKSNRSGLICSGEQWVAFYPLNKSHLSLTEEIAIANEENIKGLVTFGVDGITYHKGKEKHHSHKDPVSSTKDWEFSESTGLAQSIYIFGAGHVGLALSRIMHQLGFVIHLFDDRENLSTMIDNTFADFKSIVDYKAVADMVPEGSNIYIVIMTFGHKSDEVVLRQLLNKKIKYLGLMGSTRKVEKIFSNLISDGFGKDSIRTIDAPIGIPIGSQTADEIAVSIAAKIIKVKNELPG
jgi:xanthine dehydrogenase accessory factor